MKQPIICDVLVNPSQITCDVVGIQVFILSHALLKKMARQGGVTEIVIVPLYISCPVKKKVAQQEAKGVRTLDCSPPWKCRTIQLVV